MFGRGGGHAAFLSALFSLEGQVALVTGAARGLGLEMARALAAAGATVLLGGRDPTRLEAAVEQIRQDGGIAAPIAFDLDDAPGTAAALQSIASTDGRLDILVANAGVRNRTGFGGFDRGSFMDLLATNLVASGDICHRAAQAMASAGRGGRIIVLGSMVSSMATAGDPAYLAAKAGLTGLVRALAAEYGPMGVTVNEIALGSFTTEYNAALAANPQANSAVQSRTLLERWGKPEEIAAAALFLASSGAAYVTGHRLVIDGGMSLKL